MAEREATVDYFTKGMINEDGQVIDPIIPRKCAATNKILNSRDKSSVQISFAQVDENGRYTGNKETIVLSGYVRTKGTADQAIDDILKERQFLPIKQ